MSETFVIVGADLAGRGAAVAANRGRDLRRSMWLIKAQHPIDPAKLWDPDGDLRELLLCPEPDGQPLEARRWRPQQPEA